MENNRKVRYHKWMQCIMLYGSGSTKLASEPRIYIGHQVATQPFDQLLQVCTKIPFDWMYNLWGQTYFPTCYYRWICVFITASPNPISFFQLREDNSQSSRAQKAVPSLCSGNNSMFMAALIIILRMYQFVWSKVTVSSGSERGSMPTIAVKWKESFHSD